MIWIEMVVSVKMRLYSIHSYTKVTSISPSQFTRSSSGLFENGESSDLRLLDNLFIILCLFSGLEGEI
jgi:hypothetical protein